MRKWKNMVLLGMLLTWWPLAATPVHAEVSSQGNVIHVVAWGDTMFSIARRYGTTVDAIQAANSLADPTHIYAGQRLTIPIADAPAAPAEAGATHTVQAGENLYRIALRYGTTVQALSDLNGIYNPDQVVAGQTLIIPGSPTTPSMAYQPQHASTTHEIQPGETLASIAHRYDVALWTLVRINNVANPALVVPGQMLVIPRGGSLAPASTPTPVTAGGEKRIVVDLSDQHLFAYQGGGLVYSFVVSTGMPGAGTRTGVFRVLDKYPNAYASTWNLQMPYWMGIYWSGSLENGIHALPILANGQRLWEGYLGTPVSYGCVILGTQQARMLYQWAEVGMPVVIRW